MGHDWTDTATSGQTAALPWRSLWMLVLLALWVTLAMPSARAEDEFLPPEQAFAFSATMDGADAVRIDYQVAKGYYMYRERFAFAVAPAGAATLGDPVFPASEVKYDPTFDKNMEIYHGPVSIRLPLAPGAGAFTLNVTGQGCADKGVCYPPMTHTVSLKPAAGGYQIVSTGVARFAAVPDAGAGISMAPSPGSVLTAGGSASAQAGTADTAAGQAIAAGAAAAGNVQAGPAAGPVEGPAADAMAGGASGRAAPGAAGSTASTDLSRLGSLARSDDVGLAGAIAGMGWLKTAAVFLLLGVLLSLTPCVLPMIPILSSVVVGAHAGRPASRWRGVGLAAAYVFGMSLVYTALGVAAGLSGVGLAAWLQAPWVLVLFALLLAVLALAMFDVFTLQAPAGMQTGLTNWLSRVPGGRATGAFVMGAVSALIVGPCVAAPLAGALLYISQTGDVVLGGIALFAMAWGMGVPLLIVGGSAGSVLPKAGPWMEGVKRLFGMLLLGTAWWMLIPLLSTWVQMLGWALLGLIGAVMLRAFEPLPAGGGTGRMFAKGAGLLLALIAVVLLVGAASGGRDVLRPLSQLAAADRSAFYASSAQAPAPGLPAMRADGTPRAGAASSGTAPSGVAPSTASPGVSPSSAPPGLPGPSSIGSLARGGAAAPAALQFMPVRSVAELDAAVAKAGRPVLLDFYADWCVSCREMEQFTFSDPAVSARMSRMLLLRADVTANNADDRALLKRFRLFGPPGIMFFDAGGRYLSGVRVIGFQDAPRFLESLDRVAAP
jgi:thiol:disulfide interchange protein DsbD